MTCPVNSGFLVKDFTSNSHDLAKANKTIITSYLCHKSCVGKGGTFISQDPKVIN
jgi:hypothetical protein